MIGYQLLLKTSINLLKLNIMIIPILDLKKAKDSKEREILLAQLRDALFNIGFLYITNHGVPEEVILNLAKQVPELFNLSGSVKSKLSKINSPHFLGYSGYAEEVTQGKHDLREQFDFATELPVIYREDKAEQESGRDFSKLYWRLRGPNQWPNEEDLPGFKKAVLNYLETLSELSYRFVHLVEEAFGIPIGTFDTFFQTQAKTPVADSLALSQSTSSPMEDFLCPQNRLKLVKYHVVSGSANQGVGAHKDSSGWLTFLYQIGTEQGLEVLDKDENWIPANPIPGSFVVNFGNAFEAATEGAVRATIHRVKAPVEHDRYSIPFFMGLPYDLKVSEIRSFIPEKVRLMRRKEVEKSSVEIASFIDPRWDNLGESVLRKWIRSHPDVGLKWYGSDIVSYYTQ